MIVPRNRLLWLVAFLALVSLLALGIDGGAYVSGFAILAGLAVALVDQIRARSQGELLRIETPEVFRLTRNREERLPMGLRTLRPGVGRVRVGLVFPPEIESKQDELWMRPGDGVDCYEMFWECRPLKRGRYLLPRVSWQIDSPLGLWGVGGATECATELRVYPDLSRERRTVAAFFLNRGMFGLHPHRLVGRGREFERLREYMPGDGYDEIHWKATARRGAPITKVFQVERTQEVYVAIDASRLSARVPADSEGDTVLERFVTASLVLGMAAEKQGDHFGLLAFGKQVNRFLRAGSGKGHFNACRDALYKLQPEPAAPDLGDVFAFLRLRLRKRALLVFLTSLEDPLLEENFAGQIELLARKHLVIVNMLKPTGVDRLFSERGPPSSKDDLYGRLAGHMRWHEISETRKKLQRLGVQFSLLENERLSPELVSQYMRVKQRQLV